MLSRLFGNKFTDIITISSVVKTKIVQICMLFIEKTTYLNNEIFNEQIEYHILLEFSYQ